PATSSSRIAAPSTSPGPGRTSTRCSVSSAEHEPREERLGRLDLPADEPGRAPLARRRLVLADARADLRRGGRDERADTRGYVAEHLRQLEEVRPQHGLLRRV